MNRKELEKALKLASYCTVDNKIIPIFSHVCFTKTHIQSFNGVQGISVPFDSGLEFTVKEDILSKLIESFDSDIVDIVKVQDKITVKSGKSSTKISIRDNSEFVSPFLQTRKGITVTATEEFFKGIEKCLTTSNKSNLKESQNGVTFKNGILFSTDGNRITKYETDMVSTSEIFLPEKFCGVLNTLYDGSSVDLLLGQDFALATLLSCDIYTNVNSNIKVYDFDSVLKNYTTNITFHNIPEDFRKAINRADIVLGADKSKILSVELVGNMVKLQASSTLASFEETVDFQTILPAMLFNIDCSFLNQVLKNMDEISFSSDKKGSVVVGKSNNCTILVGSI
jgi:hypothetical protein